MQIWVDVFPWLVVAYTLYHLEEIKLKHDCTERAYFYGEFCFLLIFRRVTTVVSFFRLWPFASGCWRGCIEMFSATLTQKHHPLHPPPAQRAPPVDLPQARGAGQAEPAVAAREERGVGVEVDARVA
jgi:hypothetical protein